MNEDAKYFYENTMEASDLKIDNVIPDNACLYRALANTLYFNSPYRNVLTIIRKKSFNHTKNLDDIYGEYSEDQDKLARHIQDLILEYVKSNKFTKIEMFGDMDIKSLVLLFHNIEYNEYIKLYEIFAGEYHGENLLEDRWGSLLELYIISEIFKIPIIIFNCQKWDFVRNKITNGKVTNNKCEKNVRLKISSIIGRKYLKINNPICLLWKIWNNSGHYMAIYPHSIKKIKLCLG